MHYIGFNLIYLTPICGYHFLEGSFLAAKADLGNTAWAAMARLGSIGSKKVYD